MSHFVFHIRISAAVHPKWIPCNRFVFKKRTRNHYPMDTGFTSWFKPAHHHLGLRSDGSLREGTVPESITPGNVGRQVRGEDRSFVLFRWINNTRASGVNGRPTGWHASDMHKEDNIRCRWKGQCGINQRVMDDLSQFTEGTGTLWSPWGERVTHCTFYILLYYVLDSKILIPAHWIWRSVINQSEGIKQLFFINSRTHVVWQSKCLSTSALRGRRKWAGREGCVSCPQLQSH